MNTNKVVNLPRLLATICCAMIGVIGAQSPLPDPDNKPADMAKTVQVYLLLGQSNMLGFGKIKGDEGSLETPYRRNNSTPT